jgi:hypothetical protein
MTKESILVDLKTHEGIMLAVIDSFERMLEEVEINHKDIEISNRENKVAAHRARTAKIVHTWFMTGGGSHLF